MTPVLLPNTELMLRILVSAVLGGAIGFERVWHGRPAGLRTSMLIAISSCLFTILSSTGFGDGLSQDPARVASQIVVGVGFLGAGTMMHSEKHVLGLTTASTIWLVAAIGMAAGVGLYGMAVAVTALALLCLTLLAPLSTWMEKQAEWHARRWGATIVRVDPRMHYVSYTHRQAKRRGKKARRTGGLDESVGKD